MPTKSHYDILNLSSSSKLSPADVKEAYHQTLLTYHPDKLKQGPSSLSSEPSKNPRSSSPPSLDEILCAYTVLSDPAKRSSYDSRQKFQTRSSETAGHIGLETYDLEDLDSHEDTRTGQAAWTRPCRCGDKRGYCMIESDLEKAAEVQEGKQEDMREILVGCQGCSLLIRVVFGVEAG